MLNSLEDSDPSIRKYVEDIFCRYLHIPADLAGSKGKQGTVQLSLKEMNDFAKLLVYQKRKSMKSAVELALLEIGEHPEEVYDGEGGSTAPTQTNNEQNTRVSDEKEKDKQIKELVEKNKRIKELEEKDESIKELETQLQSEKTKHTIQIQVLNDLHSHETKETEAEYTKFVSDLIKKNQKKMDAVTQELECMKNVHRTFLESFVETVCELDKNKK